MPYDARWNMHLEAVIMTDSDTVTLTRAGAVATVTFNRPQFGNAINQELARALMEAAIVCDEDASIRCVILTGAGRMFCAGGDVADFAAAGEGAGGLLKNLTGYLHIAVSRLKRMRKPLLTAVNGPAAGAGFGLAILGDLAFASRSAHFTLAYSAIGLSPDGGSTWMLPRLIGLRRAQELMMLNRRVPAEEAADMGLITRCLDDAQLLTEVNAVAEQLASAATVALGRTRQLLIEGLSASFETQMENESRTMAETAATADAREGIAAFKEKRKAHFVGKP